MFKAELFIVVLDSNGHQEYSTAFSKNFSKVSKYLESLGQEAKSTYNHITSL